MNWSEHITVLGQGAKALVFFHGWGFDSSIWLDMAVQFTDKYNYTVYLVNLPGFGGSPWLPWEQFKVALLPALPETFAVIAWSMGGLYATRLAYEAPSSVAHLIHLGSSPYFMMDKGWPGIRPPAMQSFYEDVLRDPEGCLKKFTGKELPSCSSSGALLTGLDLLKHWDVRGLLAGISCPMVYLFGQRDAIVPKALYKTMKALYPQCQYRLIPGAAHDLFVTHQSEVIEALEHFII